MKIKNIHITIYDNDYSNYLECALKSLWGQYSNGYLGVDVEAIFTELHNNNKDLIKNFIIQSVYGQLCSKFNGTDVVFYTKEIVPIDYVVANIYIDFMDEYDIKVMYEHKCQCIFNGNGEHVFLNLYNGETNIL